jgi:hypothetical protein
MTTLDATLTVSQQRRPPGPTVRDPLRLHVRSVFMCSTPLPFAAPFLLTQLLNPPTLAPIVHV